MQWVPLLRAWCVLGGYLLCGAQLAVGEGLEAIEAQGPSPRVAQRDASAYAQRSAADNHASDEPLQAGSQQAGSATESDSPDSRRLRLSGSADSNSKASHPAGERNADLLSGLAEGSATTALAALAFVVGLFMLFAWVVQRGMPRSSRVLPREAIRVLGRLPLGSRQFGHLLHLGNKLVLVAVNQSGVEKLAEIDDPQEVLRLLALCDRNGASGSQKEFEDIFGSFAKEKRASGFLDREAEVAGGRAHAAGGERYA